MIKILNFMKKRKLFSSLVITLLLGLLFGGIFLLLLNEESYEIMSSSINTYFSNIRNNNVDYIDSFIVSLVNNISVCIIIWLLGISIIGSLLVYIIFLFKCFSVFISFFSIINVYGIKGILLSIIYIIPYVINVLILFILSYYAISFSILIYKYFFRGCDYNRKVIVKRYIKVLIICLLLFIVTSIVDVFLIPRILLLF